MRQAVDALQALEAHLAWVGSRIEELMAEQQALEQRYGYLASLLGPT